MLQIFKSPAEGVAQDIALLRQYVSQASQTALYRGQPAALEIQNQSIKLLRWRPQSADWKTQAVAVMATAVEASSADLKTGDPNEGSTNSPTGVEAFSSLCETPSCLRILFFAHGFNSGGVISLLPQETVAVPITITSSGDLFRQ